MVIKIFFIWYLQNQIFPVCFFQLIQQFFQLQYVIITIIYMVLLKLHLLWRGFYLFEYCFSSTVFKSVCWILWWSCSTNGQTVKRVGLMETDGAPSPPPPHKVTSSIRRIRSAVTSQTRRLCSVRVVRLSDGALLWVKVFGVAGHPPVEELGGQGAVLDGNVSDGHFGIRQIDGRTWVPRQGPPQFGVEAAVVEGLEEQSQEVGER